MQGSNMLEQKSFIRMDENSFSQALAKIPVRFSLKPSGVCYKALVFSIAVSINIYPNQQSNNLGKENKSFELA